MRVTALVILVGLSVAAMFSGCKPSPAATSSGILQQFSKEFDMTFTSAPDADQDACLYPVLVRFWNEYISMSATGQDDFRYQFLKRYTSVEFEPTQVVGRMQGSANLLVCELGWNNPNGDGPAFILEHTCGKKLVDKNRYKYIGDENHKLSLVLDGSTRTLKLHGEHLAVEGNFMLYHVQNTQASYNRIESVNDSEFKTYYRKPVYGDAPFGLLTGTRAPTITGPEPIRKARCNTNYNGHGIVLRDLLDAPSSLK